MFGSVRGHYFTALINLPGCWFSLSRAGRAATFVAREFLPVVLDEEKTMARISTETRFKALRTPSLNIK